MATKCDTSVISIDVICRFIVIAPSPPSTASPFHSLCTLFRHSGDLSIMTGSMKSDDSVYIVRGHMTGQDYFTPILSMLAVTEYRSITMSID